MVHFDQVMHEFEDEEAYAEWRQGRHRAVARFEYALCLGWPEQPEQLNGDETRVLIEQEGQNAGRDPRQTQSTISHDTAEICDHSENHNRDHAGRASKVTVKDNTANSQDNEAETRTASCPVKWKQKDNER